MDDAPPPDDEMGRRRAAPAVRMMGEAMGAFDAAEGALADAGANPDVWLASVARDDSPFPERSTLFAWGVLMARVRKSCKSDADALEYVRRVLLVIPSAEPANAPSHVECSHDVRDGESVITCGVSDKVVTQDTTLEWAPALARMDAICPHVGGARHFIRNFAGRRQMSDGSHEPGPPAAPRQP
jgi:hypothetical protein